MFESFIFRFGSVRLMDHIEVELLHIALAIRLRASWPCRQGLSSSHPATPHFFECHHNAFREWPTFTNNHVFLHLLPAGGAQYDTIVLSEGGVMHQPPQRCLLYAYLLKVAGFGELSMEFQRDIVYVQGAEDFHLIEAASRWWFSKLIHRPGEESSPKRAESIEGNTELSQHWKQRLLPSTKKRIISA